MIRARFKWTGALPVTHDDQMYDGDSFYTLSTAGQFGLILVACSLSFGWLLLGWLVMRRYRLWLRLILAVTLFAGFVWMSPQVFYQYYHLLFEGLPRQWVIQTPPSPATLLSLLTFRGPATLSAHSLGALGWGLGLLAVWNPFSGRLGRRPA